MRLLEYELTSEVVKVTVIRWKEKLQEFRERTLMRY